MDISRRYRKLVLLWCLLIYPLLSFGGIHQFENDRIEIAISTKQEYDNNQFPLERTIVSFINGATKTLDIAVQEIRWNHVTTGTNPIRTAIHSRAENGVKIRIILEKSYLKEGSDNLETFDALSAHPNIEIMPDQNSAIMHNKFVVRDYETSNAALLSGSTNFTDTGVRRNYNHVIIIHFNGQHRKYFEIIDKYHEEFEELWGSIYGNKGPDFDIPFYRIGGTTIRVLHSPDNDPDDYLLNALTKAESSLDVMMFTFGSNSALLSGVINRFNAAKFVDRRPTDEKKLKVRVGMESEQARYWSAYPVFKALKVPVKLEKNSNAKLHHKTAIIDNKTVIMGSYNWTLAANEKNDENTVVVSNTDIAKIFTDAFEELWNEVLR